MLTDPMSHHDAGDDTGHDARDDTGNQDVPSPLTWRRAVVYGLLGYLVSRLVVLAGAGVRASQVAVDANEQGEPSPGSGFDLVTGVFTSWDGLWYLAIVRDGYPRSIPENITFFQDEARAAFFPVFPFLVRAVDTVLPGGDTLAALGLNLVLGALAVVLVGVLARRIAAPDPRADEIAARSMILFAVFPGSFVLTFAYAEATMLVLAAACLILLHDERWVLAGLVAALATATRPNGVALVAACAIAALIAIRARRDWSALAAPLLSPIGFVGFQAFLARHTDEALPWFRVQREAWAEGTSFGTTAVNNTLSFITAPLSSPTDALTAVSLIALGIGLWCAWRWKRLPPAALAYVAVIVALMLLPETVTARPRFVFTAFPLVIAVAAVWPRRDRLAWELAMVVCGAGLAALTGLYAVFGAIP